MATPREEIEALARNRPLSVLTLALDARGGGELRIDGTPLLERIRAIELPYATAEVADAGGETLTVEELAGRYVNVRGGLWEQGEFADDDPRSEKAVLLLCDCGFAECWSLLARVTVLDDRVVWSDFQQSARRWAYDLVFVFEREDYERALTP